jgi:hypothetical protein
VIKVYDGDSLTLVWEDAARGHKLVYANCRLHGIDAPELRGAGAAEKRVAESCRDLLRDAFLGELLEFDTTGPTGLDKYGRPLVIVRSRQGWTSREAARKLGGKTLNDWILTQLPGVVPYFGGTKGVASPPVVGAPSAAKELAPPPPPPQFRPFRDKTRRVAL